MDPKGNSADESTRQRRGGAAKKRGGKAQPDPSHGHDLAGDAATVEERRRSPRFFCSGSVDLFADGSNLPMSGTLADISLHGCYIEMPTTFPVNTRVVLVMESGGIRIRGAAIVRTSYPFLGMGMCFTDMAAGQKTRLKQLLATLAPGKNP